jgi:hypothetical protein
MKVKKSYYLDVETHEQIVNVSKELGMNQGQLLKEAVQIYAKKRGIK